MNTNIKIILIISSIVFGILLLININFAYSFKKYGLDNIDKEAQVLSEVVKSSLTTQMQLNVIDKKEFFLNELKNLKNIDKIWLTKGQKVIDLFGLKDYENKNVDDIDKEVLKTGIAKREIEQDIFANNTYRITIPYKATSQGSINCISCHYNAKEGDILGAISIVIPIDEAKKSGIKTMIYTFVTSLFLVALIAFLINRLISPFLIIFDSIKIVMNKAQKGNYTNRVVEVKNKEAQEVRNWINKLLDKLENTLKEIDSKISIFLAHETKVNDDQLMNVKNTVFRLTNTYKFRKSIENDDSLEDIYQRIVKVFKQDLNLHDFNIIESNKSTQKRRIVYAATNIYCDAEKEVCRADKTLSTVDSYEELNDLCKACHTKNLNYICLPYDISNELTIVVSIYPKTKEEADEIRNIIPYMNDYIDASKSVIITNTLMNILDKNAKTDQLTGLHNRKHLEDQMPKIVSQVSRSNITYGVLLLDVDHFKKVNDTYGHDVGDLTLKVVAQTISETTRTSDIVIRYGGEEFVILLYNCNESSVVDVANKIRQAFENKTIYASNQHIKKTVSIGASIFPSMHNDLETCIKYADLALYEAKRTGRNKVVLFSKELEEDKK